MARRGKPRWKERVIRSALFVIPQPASQRHMCAKLDVLRGKFITIKKARLLYKFYALKKKYIYLI